MAAKPETGFINSINKHLKEIYFEKTNNPFRSGIADSWYSGERGDLWVEYKYEPNLPKIKEYLPNLSPRQLKWLGDREDEGRNVAVILGFPEGGVIYHTRRQSHRPDWYNFHSWLEPQTRDQLLQRALTRQELAKWIFETVGMSPCKSSSGRSPAQP
jgi:hypothetical protein